MQDDDVTKSYNIILVKLMIFVVARIPLTQLDISNSNVIQVVRKFNFLLVVFQS